MPKVPVLGFQCVPSNEKLLRYVFSQLGGFFLCEAVLVLFMEHLIPCYLHVVSDL